MSSRVRRRSLRSFSHLSQTWYPPMRIGVNLRGHGPEVLSLVDVHALLIGVIAKARAPLCVRRPQSPSPSNRQVGGSSSGDLSRCRPTNRTPRAASLSNNDAVSCERNAREIDPQELGVLLAVRRRVQDRIRVVENIASGDGSRACVFRECLNQFGIQIRLTLGRSRVARKGRRGQR